MPDSPRPVNGYAPPVPRRATGIGISFVCPYDLLDYVEAKAARERTSRTKVLISMLQSVVDQEKEYAEKESAN